MQRLRDYLFQFFCTDAIKKMERKLHIANRQIDLLEASLEVKNRTIDVLKLGIESWKRQADYYQTKYELLKVETESPDLSFAEGTPFKTYEILPYGELDWVSAADPEYLAYSKDDWLTILGLIQPRVKGLWRKNIWDCDNFSELMHAYTALAFRDSGMELQGYICIAWSTTHAYNIFITDEEAFYVYEPQTGKVVGLMDELDGRYGTRIMLLPH